MGRFGNGPIQVESGRVSRETDVAVDYTPPTKNPPSRPAQAKPTTTKKKAANKSPIVTDAPALEELVSRSPIVQRRGGGLILPASARAARTVQSAVIQAQLAHSFKKSGDTQQFIGTGSLRGLWIGVPMWASSAWDSDPIPGCLPMEWIAGATGMPIGTVITLAGVWGSTKSTLALELMRWIDLYGGFGNYIDHESKLSPNLPPGLLGDSIKRVMIHRARSVDHWQQICKKQTDAAIHTMLNGVPITTKHKLKNGNFREVTKIEKIGRSRVLGLAVDTISGKMSQENQEKTWERGHGDRAHPHEALMNTNFFKTLPNILEQWPVLVVLVSQTKLGKDSQGFETRSKAGGQQVQFVESFDLDLRRVKKFRAANYEGSTIKIKNDKNSFGTDHRVIQVDSLRWTEPDDSPQGWQFRTAYDWNAATVTLLASKAVQEGIYKKNLTDAGWHMTITKTGDVANAAYSKTLGMTKEDAVPFRVLGDMIHRNPEVLTMIRKALRIQEIAYLDGDILEQRDAIRREYEKKHPNILSRLVAEHSKKAMEEEAKKIKKKSKEKDEKEEAERKPVTKEEAEDDEE